jgi:photosystem II stability/assembly factor-like uncharacterized protein
MIRSLQFLLLMLLALCLVPAIAQKLDMEKLEGMKPRSIGPAGMSGRVTAIDAVHSQPHIIYVGSASGGLWKSESGGIAWAPIFDKETTASIGAIAITQSNPSVVWAGTGEGNPRNSLNGGYGIYKSLDAGKSWQLMGLEKTRHIHRIIIHPDNPDIVWVAAIGSPWGAHPERGVYKTVDGGKNWKRILFTNDLSGCAELVIDPSNPNKLMAAMWEHKRWPWFFKSGGEGSGLYVTHDGGDTWVKRTDKDGLPAGELGRIGLAIARNKPNVVYALVESKKNALYRSEDGGFKWKMVNDKDDIGNRPFYYHEIYVDPKNENRVYSIFTYVNVSEDGGKSFNQLVGWNVHLDHHAWWIHPEDPNYIIDGNDGGMAISRDQGKSWQFVENLPLGQFYHINVDNDYPYNVYGGLQDNGTWVGPAYVLKAQGIRNSYFQEVMFGDGFDAMPDPDNNRYGYGMSQGGNLGRFDRETGFVKTIRPTHPDAKVMLRYNWNSALAQDPFDNSTIYYGSQFVHKSNNKGDTWEVISPDLTTNNPEKQKPHESGGLTLDATNAENHCTIIAIAPSKAERNVIWVGTDDGKVQVTRDGGKTWNDVTSRMAGMPREAWVPQIQTSSRAGEAFVVVNNYRLFDYKPYLFRTKDYGQTWQSLVSPTQVGENNFTLSVVQDIVEPKLLFLGTENGLWVSIDEGANWTRWTNGYPAGLSTYDMVIHPKEHDLVIGTFGRAIYVLDDIRPLREMASKGGNVINKTLHVFTPPDATIAMAIQPAGIRFAAEAMFNGDNRPFGAMISYVVNKPGEQKAQAATAQTTGRRGQPAPAAQKEEPKSNVKYDSVTLEVFNSKGELIHTLKQKAPEKNGLHRMYWGLDEKEARMASRHATRGRFEPGGVNVMPGTYKLRITFGDQKDSTNINVRFDPRLETTTAALQARYNLLKQVEQRQVLAANAMDRLRESKAIVEEFEKRLKDQKGEEYKSYKDISKVMKDSINKLMDEFVGKEDDRQGIVRNPEQHVNSMIGNARRYIGGTFDMPGATQERAMKQMDDHMNPVIKRVNDFYTSSWADYRKKMETLNVSIFKDYEPLR